MKLISADWSAADNIRAVTTTRLGGTSLGPYAGLNLGDHVDDAPDAVIKNRRLLVQKLGLLKQPQWLNQVHGTTVIKASDAGTVEQADACWSDETGQACIVMTADCLPVFFTDLKGTRVAVAHAGWRGLADGVLEQTLSVFSDPSAVIAWMGPAIGQQAFEVGGEVREQFCDLLEASVEAFIPSMNQGKWLADIYQLARLRLNRAGVPEIGGGNYCTASQPELFYSYRREGVTGRMASVIWID
ncbi:peptidoglycan editing factor PgeF [Amphritea sp.]|uniref:peptidoglycan editing factor PgeF n=1 Tax=Amphritea sp. TaxID=1872502 RepID=UPI0025B960B1|nr:peptidoglycan editing factor PgeF [Amphritea sp.]